MSNREVPMRLFDNFTEISGQKDLDLEVDKIFSWLRERGFPHYRARDYCPVEELSRLKSFDESTLCVGVEIGQTMHSMGFLWSFFPHWTTVMCGGSKESLIELWEDDDKLKTLIRKTYKWELKHGCGKLTENRIRQNAKVYLSKQSVSNFRPTAAKYIYNEYGKEGAVLDMCAGWGGRLFGFLGSNCSEYVGVEPSARTYGGLEEISTLYGGEGKKVQIIHGCAEEQSFEKGRFNLCFTSPPYFDCEKYSDEPTQSYLKYATPDEWKNGFLRGMLSVAKDSMKADGRLLINISNTAKHGWIESATLEVCKSLGLSLNETLKLALSSISGSGVKYEPIFVFSNEDNQ